MKTLFFYLLMTLNLIALSITVFWFIDQPTYEPAAVAFALTANLLGVLYTRPHWQASSPRTSVKQTSNRAGRDIAGRDIVRTGSRPDVG